MEYREGITMGTLHKFKHQQPTDDILVSNLQQLMRDRKVNEAELSRQTEIPQPTLHKILSGKTTDPRISTLKVLAEYFEVALDDLYQENLGLTNKQLPKGISIPVISWADCLNAKNHINTLTTNNCDKWIVIESAEHEYVYGLVSKPCFEPFFPRGTVLVIDPEQKPQDGDLIVVHYPETNEATLRELSIDGPTQLLLPLNDAYDASKLDKSIKVLGVVMQSRFSYS